MTFPEEGPRQALVDATRNLPSSAVAELLRDARQRLRPATSAPTRRDPAAVPAPFKIVQPKARERFVTCVPCSARPRRGGFQPGASDPSTTWVTPPTRRKLREGMFVARVIGRSMEPRIPDGSFCLFGAPVAGDLRNRTLLVQHRGIHDADTGTSYTVKRFERERPRESGPRTTAARQPRLRSHRAARETDDANLRVVAELLEVLSG
nr:hypothetical protein [Deltaproteobacteria bacterium]